MSTTKPVLEKNPLRASSGESLVENREHDCLQDFPHPMTGVVAQRAFAVAGGMA